MRNSSHTDSRSVVRIVGLAVIALIALTADGPFSRLTVAQPAAQTPTRTLRARVPFEKPGQTRLRASDDPRVIVVKFREGTRIRQRGRALVGSLAHRLSPPEIALRDRVGLDDGLIDGQLAIVNGLVAGQGDAVLQRLFDRHEDELEQEQRRGEAQSGREIADLSLYYLVVRNDADASREVLLDQLNALDIVEIAYAESKAKPAGHIDIAPATADFTAEQGYLGPWGVSANLRA